MEGKQEAGPLLRVSGDVTWHRRLRPPLKADIRLMTARHGHGNLINCLQISRESVDIKRDGLNIMNVPGAAPEEGRFYSLYYLRLQSLAEGREVTHPY